MAHSLALWLGGRSGEQDLRPAWLLGDPQRRWPVVRRATARSDDT